jgi:hypothetical protein
MDRKPESGPWRLGASDTARFTTMVAVLAIFSDAALGHGLTWENDPYWTYWITKTFLIATVFGLGTAWFGIGAWRGALITAVHTVVLTVYYWTFSPIGLPSSPEWLDLQHTWITGVPIHFAVIYVGYLMTLWLWGRRARLEDEDSAGRATAALLFGVAIVIVAGGISSLVLGDFPGLTWFLVRVLLTIPFLLWWWAWAGRDQLAAVVGGIVLALIWGTYAHFLGPVGLPDTPLRLFSGSAPPATVEFLDYRQTWLISVPIYLVVMSLILLLDAALGGRGPVRRPAVAAAAIAGVIFLTAGVSEQTLGQQGTRASVSASGPVQVETGAFYSNQLERGTGEITMAAEDMGGRVTPLPPRDRLDIAASIQAGESTVEVTATEPLVSHPAGEHTTWWGVGIDVGHHGESGIGTDALPPIESAVAVFGIGEVSVDGTVVATGVPVHVMTAQSGLPNGATLELDVGSEGEDIPGLPTGHLRVLWAEHTEEIEDPNLARYLGGGAVTLLVLALLLWMIRREARA